MSVAKDLSVRPVTKVLLCLVAIFASSEGLFGANIPCDLSAEARPVKGSELMKTDNRAKAKTGVYQHSADRKTDNRTWCACCVVTLAATYATVAAFLAATRFPAMTATNGTADSLDAFAAYCCLPCFCVYMGCVHCAHSCAEALYRSLWH